MSKSEVNVPSHRLRRLSVVGGFMDGTDIEFSPGLNCIIGGRGTGKTTLLEFIRFVLDAMPEDAAARKRVESLLGRNLDFGRVELEIQTRDGVSYVVSRCPGEDPVVMNADGSHTNITLKAGGFFKADIFSQNEVESIADRSLSQLDLLDNFEAERIADLTSQIKHVTVELTGNASGIIPLRDKIATLDEELAALPGIEEKLKGMSGTGGSDSEAINEAHEQKALRDREKRGLDELTQFLEKCQRGLGEYIGTIEQEASSRITVDMMKGANAEILNALHQRINNCGSKVDALLEQALEDIAAEQAQLADDAAELATSHSVQEMAFRTLIEKHQETMGQANERSNLEKRRNELLAKTREREDATQKLERLQEERVASLRTLSELRDARFQIRKAIADRINEAVCPSKAVDNDPAPSIRVTVMQDGNPDCYAKLLEEALRKARVKAGQVAKKIVNSMWPADLVNIVKLRQVDELVEKADLNRDQAEKVIAELSASEHLYSLETVELIDLPSIELNDGGTYKDSQSLSTGQKCTTILPILLMESERPLLVDQPEDNLDNRFITQTIVESLNKVKAHRQLIFVTHNPNIPVLGDASKVFVMDSDGMAAHVEKEGTADACKDEIVTLLEGGEDAFRLRKERYRY